MGDSPRGLLLLGLHLKGQVNSVTLPACDITTFCDSPAWPSEGSPELGMPVPKQGWTFGRAQLPCSSEGCTCCCTDPSALDPGDISHSTCGACCHFMDSAWSNTQERGFFSPFQHHTYKTAAFYPQLSDGLLLQLSEGFQMSLPPQRLQNGSTGNRRKKLQAAECAGLPGYEVHFKA